MAKTALITGSTSGIGLSLAESFAANGYNITFNGLENDGAATSEEIASRFGVGHLFSNTNMQDAKALRKLADETVNTFGRLDVLINNAGIQHISPIEDFPEQMWDAIVSINLSAAFHLTKAVWPYMKSQHFGRIINIASVHGLVASENKSAYVAAKHGLIGFTKAAALEGAPFGIIANAICPGFVRTALVQNQIDLQVEATGLSEPEVIEKLLRKHAVREFIPVAAITDMALLLASENARSTTGAAFTIDGGWSAQ
ncbi:MAG TPA: 3-hydroxybutyrate dehydrogenase [Flavobacterium sp.]|jgi:3-hydroxybutyrate dehydrogenase